MSTLSSFRPCNDSFSRAVPSGGSHHTFSPRTSRDDGRSSVAEGPDGRMMREYTQSLVEEILEFLTPPSRLMESRATEEYLMRPRSRSLLPGRDYPDDGMRAGRDSYGVPTSLGSLVQSNDEARSVMREVLQRWLGATAMASLSGENSTTTTENWPATPVMGNTELNLVHPVHSV